jgi:hypothetical protein
VSSALSTFRPAFGGAYQLNHGDAVGERPATPVLRDITEQPNLILFHSMPGGWWWANHQLGLVDKPSNS